MASNLLYVSHQGERQHRAALDAYWEFVRENPQDFNGWAYLIQVQNKKPKDLFYIITAFCNLTLKLSYTDIVE